MHTDLTKLSPPSGVNFGTSRTLLAHHVAKRLGLSSRMVRYLAETGKLHGVKSGKKIWKFLAAEVEEFRAQREARHV